MKIKIVVGFVMNSKDTKLVGLIKTKSIIYVDLKSLIKRIDDVKIILRYHPQQELVSIFPVGIRFMRYKM